MVMYLTPLKWMPEDRTDVESEKPFLRAAASPSCRRKAKTGAGERATSACRMRQKSAREKKPGNVPWGQSPGTRPKRSRRGLYARQGSRVRHRVRHMWPPGPRTRALRAGQKKKAPRHRNGAARCDDGRVSARKRTEDGSRRDGARADKALLNVLVPAARGSVSSGLLGKKESHLIWRQSRRPSAPPRDPSAARGASQKSIDPLRGPPGLVRDLPGHD